MSYIHRAIHDSPLSIHALAWEAVRDCKVIVDVGCGPGRLAAVFPGVILIGVDIHGEAQMCLQRGYSEFYQINVEDEPLPTLDGDGMVLSHVLEHFVRPDRALANALHALRGGATIYAVSPTIHNSHYYDDYTHIRPFTEIAMVGLMKDVGLSQIRLLYDLQAPFPGAGRLLHLWTKGDPRRKQFLCMRFPMLRAKANVHVLAIVPNV